MATSCPAAYRARSPRATSLNRLLETHFEEVRGQWEDRFQGRCGFWRGFVDEQVLRYLDCGLFENGFARIRCSDCSEEYLLAFSCKTRELCPSCAAKRSAATAALLSEDVFEEVAHAQWVFVIPKMLRPYFLHHRELLGGMARVAWETVIELMCAATGDDGMRPGMVAVCPESETQGSPGRIPCKMPDAVRGGGAKEGAEVSNGCSRGGLGVRMPGTLDGAEKQIPIPRNPTMNVIPSILPCHFVPRQTHDASLLLSSEPR